MIKIVLPWVLAHAFETLEVQYDDGGVGYVQVQLPAGYVLHLQCPTGAKSYELAKFLQKHRVAISTFLRKPLADAVELFRELKKS